MAYNKRSIIVCFSLKEDRPMYKTDIVRTVAKETRLSQRIVDDVLTETLATIYPVAA